jgi:hypothetical protein
MTPHGHMRWWSEVALFFFVHLPVGVLGATYFPFLIAVLLKSVLGTFPVFLFGPPVYPLQIVIAFALGHLLNQRLRSKSAAFLWIVGGIWLWYDIRAYMHIGPVVTGRLFLAPLFSSIAYSIGAWLGYRRGRALPPS